MLFFLCDEILKLFILATRAGHRKRCQAALALRVAQFHSHRLALRATRYLWPLYSLLQNTPLESSDSQLHAHTSLQRICGRFQLEIEVSKLTSTKMKGSNCRIACRKYDRVAHPLNYRIVAKFAQSFRVIKCANKNAREPEWHFSPHGPLTSVMTRWPNAA